MAQTSSIYDHFNFYLIPMTLTVNLHENIVSDGTSPPPGQQLCIIILKSMHKCTSYGPDKLSSNINVPVMPRTSSIYDHFDIYLTPVTLTFNLHENIVSDSTSPPPGQQLCIIILKSMHKCTSYGPNKLNI